MKFLKLVLLLVLFIASGVNAQTYKNQNTNPELDGFQNKTSEMNFLSAQNAQSNFFSSAATSSNNVFINQIGDGNNASVTTKSDASDINILQNGSDNGIYYNISARTIQETLVQNGDNNNILHTNPFNLDYHSAQVLQNGNNQNLEWYGANSVSERLKVSMQGENQSVIIRSFN